MLYAACTAEFELLNAFQLCPVLRERLRMLFKVFQRYLRSGPRLASGCAPRDSTDFRKLNFPEMAGEGSIPSHSSRPEAFNSCKFHLDNVELANLSFDIFTSESLSSPSGMNGFTDKSGLVTTAGHDKIALLSFVKQLHTKIAAACHSNSEFH